MITDLFTKEAKARWQKEWEAGRMKESDKLKLMSNNDIIPSASRAATKLNASARKRARELGIDYTRGSLADKGYGIADKGKTNFFTRLFRKKRPGISVDDKAYSANKDIRKIVDNMEGNPKEYLSDPDKMKQSMGQLREQINKARGEGAVNRMTQLYDALEDAGVNKKYTNKRIRELYKQGKVPWLARFAPEGMRANLVEYHDNLRDKVRMYDPKTGKRVRGGRNIDAALGRLSSPAKKSVIVDDAGKVVSEYANLGSAARKYQMLNNPKMVNLRSALWDKLDDIAAPAERNFMSDALGVYDSLSPGEKGTYVTNKEIGKLRNLLSGKGSVHHAKGNAKNLVKQMLNDVSRRWKFRLPIV